MEMFDLVRNRKFFVSICTVEKERRERKKRSRAGELTSQWTAAEVPS